MQNNQKKWSDAEKQQLIQLVDKFTINKRTQWVEISKYLDRTANQCKTQYSLCDKLKISQIMQFTMVFQIKIATGNRYSYLWEKWKLIKNIDFPEFTSEQLRQKYIHIKSNTLIREQMKRKIMNFQQINPKEFSEKQMETFIWLYNKFCCSQKSFDSLEQRMILKTMGLICENVDVTQVLNFIYEQLPPTYKKFLQNSSDKQ
ncbi:Myb-like_DNA-binding domain-containing protein [Hexamita inflata]|uniref:Myb-like DNA-binding domain-containing protein n=1 Tax=Hexamita inflata TaxID=28002 RepID=A0AA86N4P7_9EUKA|nr:Myb-like DNA-binding domain-containing protein [Hexamita inflata]